MREEYWQRRHMAHDEEAQYWEEQRRYEEDWNMEWFRRTGSMPPYGGPRGRPFGPVGVSFL